MGDADLLAAVQEIRELIRLMAEPQIAARDQKLRDELVRLVGKSVPKAKSTLLMDGTNSQADIRAKTGIHQGDLSTFVKNLGLNKLLVGDVKLPKLAIPIPPNFFDKAGKA